MRTRSPSIGRRSAVARAIRGEAKSQEMTSDQSIVVFWSSKIEGRKKEESMCVNDNIVRGDAATR